MSETPQEEGLPSFLQRIRSLVMCEHALRTVDARRLLDIAESFWKLERSAAKHVETVIIGRTGFTGEKPYVGWEGLGKALNEALDERDALAQEAQELRAENDRIRAALAHSDRPCVYCSLPAEEWAKCQSGFPGCARADDMTGCPNFAAQMEAEALREENTAMRATLAIAVTSGGYRRGYKLVEALRDAVRGDLASVVVDGLTWVRKET